MAERKWTGPQSDAILARGGSVLVSAAAGSGKTAVLVERAIRLICDPEQPVDADRLLIVTFSRAAAAEMKQRISARLTELIRQDPLDIRLQKQQALLGSAQISTVDSFCLDLVRRNFQNLEISPDFTMIDEAELTVMELECVGDCIEAYYENDEDGSVRELVELLSTGRDDSRLGEVIRQIYNFSRSHPFYEDWLDEKLSMYSTDLPVAETVWGGSILDYAARSIGYCLQIENASLDLIYSDEKMEKAYANAFTSDLRQLEQCCDRLEARDWDGSVEALRGFVFEKLGPLRGDDSAKMTAKAARDQTKKIVQDLSAKYLNATAAEFREDLADLQPKIAVLFQMVREYAARLDRAKAEKKRLHFADIQHLAIRLLVEATPEGYHPSEHARQVAAQYDYVLVDEYQDTNEVQDMLFTCVSRNQTNLFFVGDVKQSIYSFRQAMPEIFMGKKRRFFPYDSGQYPAKIILDTNFRSRSEVTGAVNYIFRQIMSEAAGDVDYNEEESLRCGAAFPDYSGVKPELLLISMEEYSGNLDAAQLEAREIGLKIREMLADGYCVNDNGTMRPVMLRDFCILMRSPKARAGVYVTELGRQGITAVADQGGGFLAAREISAVVSFLKALDNPLLDVELVAAMLSPLLGFTADDIARIRIASRGTSIYTAIRAAAGEGDGQCAAFLDLVGRLRAEAALLPADRLLMRIYDETDALAIFRAMEMGEGRKANLLLLIEYAAAYHSMGYKQLGGFVGFLGRLSDRQGDLATANTLGDGANAVRIMSVHRSKGLEFPVVFLADTSKQFNKVDLRQNTLLHSKYGFACVRRDHETFKQFPTVPMQSIRLQAQRSILSEEMRILYVALTRAREKLIVTGVVKSKLQKKLTGLACPLENGKLPSYLVGECSSYVDWILMALLHHPSCAALCEEAGGLDLETVDDGNLWMVRVARPEDDEQAQTAEAERIALPEPDPALLDDLRNRSQWVYPWDAQTKIPTKLAVSAVAKGELAVQYRFSARPRFLSNQALTPTEKGNAMHKFMQFSDYRTARDDLDGEITRLREERFLSYLEAESLSKPKLRSFFRSKLAKRIFASQRIWRELKFMAECGKDMLGETVDHMDETGKIVLQGVADCVFEEDGKAVIVDYKTDRVTSAEELIQKYESQLRLYREILGKSLGIPVGQCMIYSFALSVDIEI